MKAMPHWKLTLAYDGTSFHGWQVQPGLPTIQGTLAQSLFHLTGEVVLPQGSGRTDAGVHALAQTATFPLQAPIPPANLLRALNRNLPPAIRVLDAARVPPDFHARYSALRKTYEYRIFARVPADRRQPDLVCPPFLAPYAWDCPWYIDLGLANRAATAILGEHDFTSFAAVDPELRDGVRAETRSALRTILSSSFTRFEDLVTYRVTGSGFLHHMVRNLTGTFVDIASGRLSPDAIFAILAARSRSAAGPTAPAHGLYLVSVEYPESDMDSAT